MVSMELNRSHLCSLVLVAAGNEMGPSKDEVVEHLAWVLVE